MLKAFLLALFAATCIQSVDAQDLCDRVSEIKSMPVKDEHVNDAAFNALVEAGESAIPCLIAKITDTRRMRDPRSEPGYGGIQIRVGDVAYFVLADITKTAFIDLLPARVQRDYRDEGILAYLKFVQKRQNRVWFQRRLRDWYRGKYGKGSGKSAA
jgi:hypothetical protein